MAQPNRPDLTVVVTTYNRAALLARCLQCLLAQEGAPDHEIVVVDDGSDDGTRDIPQLADPRVRYHWQPNAGRSAARNKGLELARGRILVYVDSDVFVVRDFVAAHAAAYSAGRAGYFAQGISVDVSRLVDPDAPGVAVVDPSRAFFDTKNVSLPTDLLREAGGFSSDFTQYGWEDLEAGMRLRDLGIRKVRASGAIGFHYRPAFQPGDLERLICVEVERGRMGARFFRLRPTWEVRLMVGLTPFHRAAFWLMTGGGRRPDGAWPRLVRWLTRKPDLAAALLPGLLAPRGYAALCEELTALGIKI
jgi:glycosyltransferase involved in cell wall biosynthesis